MTPWSVIAMAGIPCSAAERMSSSMRLAPSNIEYSVWVWMWTKLSDNLPPPPPGKARVGKLQRCHSKAPAKTPQGPAGFHDLVRAAASATRSEEHTSELQSRFGI